MRIYKLFIASLMAFIFIGCGDNNYDGETGLQTAESSIGSVEGNVQDIYKLVIQKDSEDAYIQTQILLSAIEDLNTSTNEANLQVSRDEFKKLVYAYKRVESAYVAGYNSDDMRDIADFYIESFIKGSKSQDIGGDLDEVFAGNKSIVINALKGITALEYTLFGNVETVVDINMKMNQNRKEAALLMATNLVEQLKIVKEYYENDGTFLSSTDEAISALLNVLVDNSFRLRESRVGDAAGFTAKYIDDPDNTRLEYFKSTNSLEAIKEILNTHKRVMEGGLRDIAIAGSAASEADAISVAIEDAIGICEEYSISLESELSSTRTLQLYETVRTLQNNYTGLINGLNFTQDIVEADGD